MPLLCDAATGPLGDAAHVQMNGTRLAITTDAFDQDAGVNLIGKWSMERIPGV